MAARSTVIFADLTGSTGLYESLGNDKAAKAIQNLTGWMGAVCREHDGRVVKSLGDGILVVFADPAQALDATCRIQQDHQHNISSWPAKLRMQVKIGMAEGPVVLAEDGDCYGDPVNLAARLSDMAGAAEIWASHSVVEHLPTSPNIRYRTLGSLAVKGFSEPQPVARIEWNEDVSTAMLTLPASISELAAAPAQDTPPSRIELGWLNQRVVFDAAQAPLEIGRDMGLSFVVNDPRVSRRHARVDWMLDHFVLTDLSSYGTWVRFAGNAGEVPLRRGDAVLHGEGEIALGAPFSDFSAPMMSFRLVGGGSVHR